MRKHVRLTGLYTILLIALAVGLPDRTRAQGIITTIAGADLVYPTTPFGALTASFGELSGAAISPSGDVYFASKFRSQIIKYHPQQNTMEVIAGIGVGAYSGDGGTAVSSALHTPTQLAFDKGGNLYIADQGNGAIRRIDTSGVITTIARLKGGVVNGVTVSADGTVYASDNTQIYRVGNDGVATSIAGSSSAGFAGDGGPATQALLNVPTVLAFDTTGNLLIIDSQNLRVRRISSSGVISTIVGNGQAAFPTAGKATASPLLFITGLTPDTSGNVYVATGVALLKVDAQGNLTNLSPGLTTFFLSQPGPLHDAKISPVQLALDLSGNLYFTDFLCQCLYRSNPQGTAQVVAAYAPAFGIGDGGPAISAGLSGPSGLAIAKDGSLLIADQFRHRIRQITTSNTIKTVAGTGSPGLAQPGSALSVPLLQPYFIATDPSGVLYISEMGALFRVDTSGAASLLSTASLQSEFGIAPDLQGNLLVVDNYVNRVFKIAPNGALSVFAGNGQNGFSGDGGRADAAALSQPRGITVAANGTVYIADTGNNRVRKVTPDGTITTLGGTVSSGSEGFTDITVDKQGNAYVTAQYTHRIYKISSTGQVGVIAGNGTAGFSGDGGPATSAELNLPWGVAVDDAGNVYVADFGNNRIRKILATPPTTGASTTQLSLSATAQGQAVSGSVGLTASLQGLPYSIDVRTTSSANWLSVSPLQGSAPGVLTVAADPKNLTPGTYQGSVVVNNAFATPRTITVAVTLQVASAEAPLLSIDTKSLSFAFNSGGAASSQQFRVLNRGGAVSLSVTAATSTGGNWLQANSDIGTVSAAAPATINVIATPGGLSAGTYSGTVTIRSADTGDQFSVPVTMAISPKPQKILLSQTGLTFVAVAQGGNALPQSIGILNTGSGSMSWTAQATTQTGSGWLSVSPTSGTVTRPLLDVSFVDVSISARSLPPGDYFGTIQVSVPGADNSPQVVLVVLNVLPAGSNPGPDVRPTGMVFTGVVGGSNPGSQNVNISNLAGVRDLTYGSSATYVNGDKWLNYLPSNATLDPTTPTRLIVQPEFSALLSGIYRGVITLGLSDGSIRTVSVLSVVAAGGVAPATTGTGLHPLTSYNANSCTPSRLRLLPTSLQQAFSTSLNQPASLEMQVVDDCGNPITAEQGSAAVAGSFSNGDPGVRFVHVQNGKWTATWQPRNGSPGSAVRITVTAFLALGNGKTLADQTVLTATLAGGAVVPSPRVVLNAASFQDTGVLAPGALISVFGNSLGTGLNYNDRAPLPTDLGGTQVTLGGKSLPLLYSSDGQVNAQVPFGLSVNTQLQLQVQRGSALSVPSALTVAPAQPGIFTLQQNGSGQGTIVNTDYVIVDNHAPAKAGDTVLIFCTGLGAVTTPVAEGTTAPTDQLVRTVDTVTVTIGGVPAQVAFAGLAPGFIGLYQINAIVPATPSGDGVPVIISVSGQSSPPVTMAVR